jgi:UDP-2,3-diacylglucosamine pyrophosphatase LpxH
MLDYLILSDLHLESSVCQHDKILEVLSQKSKNYIFNGDLTDSGHTKRLKKKDWKVLSKIRKLSKHSTVYYISGNHCADVAELICDLLGLEYVKNGITIEVEGKKYYVTHGDVFDLFISKFSALSNFAGHLYYLFQQLDLQNQKIPRWIKRKSKNWLKVANSVKFNAIKYAKYNGYDGIITGHTHYPENFKDESGICYYNSGCFVDFTCSYITIEGNNIEIKEI